MLQYVASPNRFQVIVNQHDFDKMVQVLLANITWSTILMSYSSVWNQCKGGLEMPRLTKLNSLFSPVGSRLEHSLLRHVLAEQQVQAPQRGKEKEKEKEKQEELEANVSHSRNHTAPGELASPAPGSTERLPITCLPLHRRHAVVTAPVLMARERLESLVAFGARACACACMYVCSWRYIF